MTRNLTQWLTDLGLEHYSDAFLSQAIEWDVLPELNDGDLQQLGVLLGDRKRILKEIAKLKLEDPGDNQPNPQHASVAERRQLTVLFCDLVGWTSISERLDPEDLRDLIGAYQDACQQAVNRYEGFIARYIGDGIKAYFGHPHAHENDAERAVLAGISITESMRDINQNVGSRKGVELAVRVGIATGPVVVGDVIGDGASEQNAVVGETPNLAARLQSIADPDCVVISSSTHRLTGPGFSYKELGSLSLKGIAKPVQAWQVLQPRHVESRFDASRHGSLLPLVGRTHELALLLDRWEQARNGEGQIVLISGEAGIGKSRLVASLKQNIHSERGNEFLYQCSPYHRNSALHPFIEQIERAAGIEHNDVPSVRLDKLESTFSPKSTIPALARLLSLPRSADPETTMSRERQKDEIFDTLIQQYKGIDAVNPTAAFFEDAHWADPTSIELLEKLFEEIQQLPVLLIVTYRYEFSAKWQNHSHITLLTLNRFSRNLVHEMIEQIASVEALPDQVVKEISDKSDGVPLFVEELTKNMMESGYRESAHGATTSPLSRFTIPVTLQDSLMARLDRLPSGKEVAQCASVIGREFSFPMVSALTSMSGDQLNGALDKLIESGLVFCRGTPPNAFYIFKHALVRDAAYESLLNSERERLHGELSELFENEFHELVQNEPEILAYHLTKANLHERAVAYWEQAGLLAAEKSAAKEAASHFSNAIQLLESSPHRSAHTEKLLTLQAALGSALNSASGYTSAETVAAYQRAWELCQKVGDSPHTVEVLYGMWNSAQVGSDYELARDIADKCLAYAERERSDTSLLIAHNLCGVTSVLSGKFAESTHHLDRAIDLYDAANHRVLVYRTGEDPGVESLVFRAWVAMFLGYQKQATAYAERAIAWARELSHGASLAYALSTTGVVYFFRGDHDKVLHNAEETIALCAQQELPYFLEWAQNLQGWALVETGQINRGLSTMSNDWNQGFSSLLMASASRFSLHPERVIESINGVIETQPCYKAEALRIKGELLCHEKIGDPAGAMECFQSAIETAVWQGAKTLELRAATSMARIWAEESRSDEVIRILEPVCEWFDQDAEIPDLAVAQKMMGAL